ncbi:MAG: VOC family protein [Bacteroidetes bacterium]|nr:VOC family protein [Bacteroidota bacterium]
MELNFGRIIILVNDYDEAFAFYERTLSCKKFFDITENGQRFLHIGLNSKDKSGIWLHKAETDEQKTRVGNQTSGIPLFVAYTDSLNEFYEHLLKENVKIVREPVENGDSRFFHFLDLYGNEIVLVEMKTEILHTQ